MLSFAEKDPAKIEEYILTQSKLVEEEMNRECVEDSEIDFFEHIMNSGNFPLKENDLTWLV